MLVNAVHRTALRSVFVRVEVEGVRALVSAVAWNRLEKHIRSASANTHPERPNDGETKQANMAAVSVKRAVHAARGRREPTGAHRMIRMNSSWFTAPSPSLSACT